ncbi:MAG: DUF4249 family protein [Gemmatimonadetes bacterium]|nr:DUF4249 family protein [Gemmatimonadota bacterium]
MNRLLQLLTLAAFVMLAVPACSPERGVSDLIEAETEDAVVVDAILIVDAPLPTVLVTRTVSPLAEFTQQAIAERSANIVIRREDGLAVTYQETSGSPGEYAPAGPQAPPVLPSTRYDITVTTADGRTVTGTTRTPPRFRIAQWLLLEDDAETARRQFQTFNDLGTAVYDHPDNQVVYNDGLLEARYPDEDLQFQVGILNLEEDSPLVVNPDFFSDEDLLDLERVLSSPPLLGDEGSLRLPWLAIYYEGRTLLRIHSIDENWYDLIRSTPGLDGSGGGLAFGGNAGENFERPLFRLEGGIGIFGSGSVDSVGFRILPPE